MKTDFVLRERLGEHGVRALEDYVEETGETWRSDVIDACFDRFDATLQRRLAETESRLSERITDSRVEFVERLAQMRVEILRWTFGFWVGQAVVVSSAIAVIFQLLR
jgi:hypothetical protein